MLSFEEYKKSDSYSPPVHVRHNHAPTELSGKDGAT